MKKSRLPLIILFAISALFLSGCSGRGSIPSSWPGITINDESIYVTHNQYTYAVQSNSGGLINQIPEDSIGGETYFAAATFIDETQILVGGYKKLLLNFNPNSGSLNWEFDGAAARWLGSSLVVDGIIYAPNADGHIYALNANGDLQWTFDAGDQIWSSPITDGENLYFSSINNSLYAVRLSNGSLVWQYDLGSAVVASPVLSDDGTLFIGTFGKTMFAIDAENGNKQWSYESIDWIWGDVAISEGSLYFGDLGGTLYVIDIASKSLTWQFQTDGTITGAPLVTADGVYAATESGTIFAISPEGSLRWRESVSSDEDVTLNGPVVAAGDLILVSSLGGDTLVYAFNANGNDMWQFIP